MHDLSITCVKFMLTGFYWKIGNWMVMREIYLDEFEHGDKILVATVGPSKLQGPPGCSLLWSVTWIKIL